MRNDLVLIVCYQLGWAGSDLSRWCLVHLGWAGVHHIASFAVSFLTLLHTQLLLLHGLFYRSDKEAVRRLIGAVSKLWRRVSVG